MVVALAATGSAAASATTAPVKPAPNLRDDDVRRTFLTEAGWAPDGAHRELDLHGNGTVRVKQVRLHTDLGTGDAPEV